MKARALLFTVAALCFVFSSNTLADEIVGFTEDDIAAYTQEIIDSHEEQTAGSNLYLNKAVGNLRVDREASGETYEAYFHIPISFEEQVPILIEVESPDLIDYRFVHLNPPNVVIAARLNRAPSTTLNWTGWVLVKETRHTELPDHVPIPTMDELPDSVKKWLASTDCCQAAAPVVQETAASLRGNTTNLLELANSISTYCNKSIPFAFTRSPASFDAVYAINWGNSCTGHAHAGAALCRANGIPARSILNIPVWFDGYMDMHWIIDYFVPEYGWIIMETVSGLNFYPSERTVVVFVSYPEDEFPLFYPVGCDEHWHTSDPALGYNPRWGRAHRSFSLNTVTTSTDTMDLAHSLTQSVYHYYTHLWGIPLPPEHEERFENAYANQQAALIAFQNGDLDSYVALMQEALLYYQNMTPGLWETLFFEDFEHGRGEWSTGGIENEWEWGVPSYGPSQAHSGTHCWGTDLDNTYENNADCWLMSPSIDLTEKGCAYMSFWVWNWVEDYWDERYDPLWLDITLDGNTFYPLCGQMGGVYDDPEIPVTGGWSWMVLDLTRYAGNTVRIRFRFQSDDKNTQPGSYIDDVHVYTKDVGGFVPSFTVEPRCGNAPLSVSFRGQSLRDIVTWQWDFDADGTIDSYEQNPIWTYEEPGTYTVGLEAFDGSASGTSSRENYISVFDGETALHFNGYNRYVRFQPNSSLNFTHVVTIETWIKPLGWGQFQGIHNGTFIDKGVYSLSVVRQGTVLNGSSLVFQVVHESGAVSYSCTPENSLNIGEWQHVAVMYESAGEVEIFINGEKQPITQLVFPSNNLTESEFIIGGSANYGTAYNGIIDEVRLWNIVRTSDEIRTHWDSYLTGYEPGLVGYWQMNEGSGGSTVDCSGNGNDGTIVDASWIQGVHLSPAIVDADEDGILDIEDNCPKDHNPNQEDGDGDGIGDICDNCPENENSDQADGDSDGMGDVCDTCLDTDGDGYGDPGYPLNECEEDNCPQVYNPEQGFIERGDIDCRGGIDVLDVLSVINHILGNSLLIGHPLDRADCNGDGDVNILDALGVVNAVLGIGECGPAISQLTITSEVLHFCQSLESYLSPDDFTEFMGLVKNGAQIPTQFHLSQNYPNPFNPTTDIRYQIADRRCPIHTTLKIYNILGQEVSTLVNEVKKPGYYSVTWDASNMANGVYFYRLKAGSFAAVKKMIIMK
ncbi:MAG: T9SS type A sorting domain-containing protein [Gemmatimonadota bacterium]|nr:MAG: T9SS type A sorting domain-containing protein [Gemmatimonadota bacterium]